MSEKPIEKMTKAELKTFADLRGYEYPANALKDDLLAIVQAGLAAEAEDVDTVDAPVSKKEKCPFCTARRFTAGPITNQCDVCFGVWRPKN